MLAEQLRRDLVVVLHPDVPVEDRPRDPQLPPHDQLRWHRHLAREPSEDQHPPAAARQLPGKRRRIRRPAHRLHHQVNRMLLGPVAQHPWPVPVGLFVLGWVLQFIGHYFEGKPPEFFSDWRFLFVGLRWWLAKMRGKA